MSRWILFFITLGLGAAAGLYYGWIVHPLTQSTASLETMREDYRADYVLMVAEAYQGDGDLSLASQRLAKLGNQPSETVAKAILFASQARYSDSDLALIQHLQRDLQSTHSPSYQVASP